MLVWLFGLLPSPGVATLALRRCAHDHGHLFGPETRETVEGSFYVDDVHRSLIDEDAGIQLTRELPALLQRGGFQLTKFCSNSAAVLRCIPEEDRAPEVKVVGDQVEGKMHTLGMLLDFGWDAYLPAFDDEVLEREVISRRDCLGVVAAIWLPLGLWFPFILPGKFIIQ